MARRRRPRREIAFSFDSFLDVVANVVGIILRLILVAWVGGRSYKAIVPTMNLAPIPVLAEPAPLPTPTDERELLLVRRREDSSVQQEQILVKDAERVSVRSVVAQLRTDLEALSAKCLAAEKETSMVAEGAARKAKAIHAVGLGEKELRDRAARLRVEADELLALPSPRKEFRYRTPISTALARPQISQ